MKTIKRIISVVLTLAMMMSLVCVPGYAEDTNAINLAIEFSASGDRTTSVTSVAAGTEFTMWVTFDGNPTELADSIQGYGLLIQYDPEKVEFPYGTNSALAGLTAPTFNHKFKEDVMYASWASTAGIVSGRDVQAEGILFSIDAKATADLTTNDLLDIVFIEEATSGDLKQTTKLIDGSKTELDYVQVLTLEREVTTIDLAIEFSEMGNREASVTSVAAGTEFSMWVTFDGNPTLLADSIQGYGLLIQYDPAKVEFPYGTNSALAGLTAPTFNHKFKEDVMYASWASTAGIVEGRNVQASGLLFQIDVKATAELTADDLRDIVFIEEATSGDLKQTTKLIDGDKKLFNYVQIPTVGEDDEPELIEIKESDFTFVLDNVEYTGEAIEPAVTATTGLVAGVDYKVVYSDNVEVGTATITVTGIGNYTGEIVKTFEIVAKEEEDNTNGKTIDLAIEFSASGDRATSVTSVAAGTEFTMWVTFAGNPTVLADSIQGYGLLIKYDPAKIEFPYGETSALAGLTAPTFNHVFTDGVMYASWASTAGIVSGRPVQASGLLFQIDAKATTELTADDLREIVFIKEATSGELKQTTKLIDGSKKLFNYVQIPTVIELVEITEADFSFDLTDKEYTGSAIEPAVTPLTGLTEGVDYKVEYSDNTEAGTATITVTGIGDYTGTIVKTFTIKAQEPAGTYGDVDGDGFVKSNDALAILKIIANVDDPLITDAIRARADVNGDGSVKSNDALAVLKIVANIFD